MYCGLVFLHSAARVFVICSIWYGGGILALGGLAARVFCFFDENSKPEKMLSVLLAAAHFRSSLFSAFGKTESTLTALQAFRLSENNYLEGATISVAKWILIRSALHLHHFSQERTFQKIK